MSLLMQNYQIESLVKISHQAFKRQIDAFVAHHAQALSQDTWFDGIKPTAKALGGKAAPHQLSGPEDFSSHFIPFVEKKIVPQDSQIMVFGDIHGDIATLLAALEHLKGQGYIDSELRLVKNNVYFVFLGDYTNRGSYGVPVVSVLLDLFMKNLGHVFLLRGNHESASTNKRFFLRHHAPTTEYAAVPFLRELAERFEGYQYPDLLLWYDYLPLTLYIGCRNAAGGIDYLTFCHGGLEIAYNPKNFLACPDSEFAMITTLDRKGALKQLACHDDTKHVADHIGRALTLQESDGFSRYQALHTQEIPIDAQSHEHHVTLRLGMLWNNFVTENNHELEFALSPTRWTVYLGKAATRYFLNQAQSDKVRILGIFRGHQHVDEAVPALGLNTTMLTDIKDRKGLVKQWDGLVYTLGASDNISGYQSFLMLSLTGQVDSWAVCHYFKKPDQQDFFFNIVNMF